MNKSGPIVIIEDDEDDQTMLREVFADLNYPNNIVFFGSGILALDYLEKSKDHPFLILSDINLPKLSGLELRDKVQNNEMWQLKYIPYLFYTSSLNQNNVMNAYSKSAQGFFTKPDTYRELSRIMKNIVEYWKDCRSPNI